MTAILTNALAGILLIANAGTFTIASTTPAVAQKELPTYSVSMTGYNAVPEQTDGDPFTTASGAYSNPEVMAARSVDLKDELPFGTVIEIVSATSSSVNCGLPVVQEHIGYRVIGDSMHPRKRNQIDLLFHTDPVIKARGRLVNPAIALGICKNVEIRVVGKIDIKDIPKSQEELRIAVTTLEKADEQPLAIKIF